MPDLWGGFPDYYRVLRVAPDASEGELRTAWRNAAKRWHPDTNRNPDAPTMMRRVNEAWHVLSDRDTRAVYDNIYHAWRTGSEQLAAELSAHLDAQRHRKQARATSADWTRWGREDRGRWEQAGGTRPGRDEPTGAGAGASGSGHERAGGDSDPSPSDDGSKPRQREQSASEPTGAGTSDRGSRSWGDSLDWSAISVVSIVVIIVVVIVITQSY